MIIVFLLEVLGGSGHSLAPPADLRHLLGPKGPVLLLSEASFYGSSEDAATDLPHPLNAVGQPDFAF